MLLQFRRVGLPWPLRSRARDAARKATEEVQRLLDLERERARALEHEADLARREKAADAAVAELRRAADERRAEQQDLSGDEARCEQQAARTSSGLGHVGRFTVGP